VSEPRREGDSGGAAATPARGSGGRLGGRGRGRPRGGQGHGGRAARAEMKPVAGELASELEARKETEPGHVPRGSDMMILP
jgi:hypothetical protein